MAAARTGRTSKQGRRAGSDREGGDEARAEKLAALREAYLAGTLDLSIPIDSPGLDRLLEDLAKPRGGRSGSR